MDRMLRPHDARVSTFLGMTWKDKNLTSHSVKPTMEILEQLRADYERFPLDQTYSLYAADVYFRDPLTSFRGIQRYQTMIQFMQTWFREVHLELHRLAQTENQIESEWTLRWVAPLPWRPQMAIAGRSELLLNADGLIVSHIDYWHCSPWDVFTQLWRSPAA